MKQIQPFQKHWLQLTSIVVCRLNMLHIHRHNKFLKTNNVTQCMRNFTEGFFSSSSFKGMCSGYMPDQISFRTIHELTIFKLPNVLLLLLLNKPIVRILNSMAFLKGPHIHINNYAHFHRVYISLAPSLPIFWMWNSTETPDSSNASAWCQYCYHWWHLYDNLTCVSPVIISWLAVHLWVPRKILSWKR